MRHLVLLLSTASAQVRIQYPFGAGPVVVQCPSGDITVTCGEAPVADDPAMGALRQQVVAMEARIARLVDEAGKASVAAAVSATGHVEVASRGKPAPSSAAAELWPPPSAAESALLSRLELTSAQLYSSADLDLSSRHLDDSDSLTLAGLLAARGASGLRALRRLWLSENRIGDEGAAAILAALKAAGGLHGLTALYLTNNHLGPPTARTLADALGGGGGAAELLELNLSENQLGDLGLQLLVEKLSLAPLPKLEELAISDNQLGDAGARALAGAVPHAHVVEMLLASNGVSDQGASALGLSLVRRARCPLRVLTLGSNSITDEGALALSEAISAPPPQRCRLAVLSLSANRLGPTAVAALGDAIVASPYLRTLHVSGNRRIGKADQEALEALLAQNRREHARLANAAGGDPAAARPVQPSAAAKKLLRGHALNAYASDLTALPRDRAAADRAALAEARAAPPTAQTHAPSQPTLSQPWPTLTGRIPARTNLHPFRCPRPQARAGQLGSLSSQLEEVRFAQAGAASEVVVLQAKADILERNLAEARAMA